MKKFLCLIVFLSIVFLSIAFWPVHFIPYIQKATVEGKPAIIMNLQKNSVGWQTFETVEARDKMFSILKEIGGGAK